MAPRDELHKRLWPQDKSTDFFGVLNKAINRLRDRLGDDATNPRFMETLPQESIDSLRP